LYLNLKYDIWLVVEPTPLKNMKVSWDDEIPNMWGKKEHKCSKPPTNSKFPGARLDIGISHPLLRFCHQCLGRWTIYPDWGMVINPFSYGSIYP
jgi:hypothetical protein